MQYVVTPLRPEEEPTAYGPSEAEEEFITQRPLREEQATRESETELLNKRELEEETLEQTRSIVGETASDLEEIQVQRKASIIEESLEEVSIQLEDPIIHPVGTKEQKDHSEKENPKEESPEREVIISEDEEITFTVRRNEQQKIRNDEDVRDEDGGEGQRALKESQQKRGESETSTPPNIPTSVNNAQDYEGKLKEIITRSRGSSEEDSLSYTGFEEGIAVHIKKVESNLETRRLAYDQLQQDTKTLAKELRVLHGEVRQSQQHLDDAKTLIKGSALITRDLDNISQRKAGSLPFGEATRRAVGTDKCKEIEIVSPTRLDRTEATKAHKPLTQKIASSDTVLDRISRVTIRNLGTRSQGNTDSDISEPISPTVEAPRYQSGSSGVNKRTEGRRRSRSVSPVGIVTLLKEQRGDKDEATLPIIYPEIPDPRKQITELLHAETIRKQRKQNVVLSPEGSTVSLFPSSNEGDEPRMARTPNFKLPVFTGAETEDYDRFFDQMDVMKEIYNWDDAQHMRIVTLGLKGGAATWLKPIPAGDKDTLEKVKGIMREAFGDRRPDWQKIRDLNNLKQEKGQTVREFALRLQEYAAKVGCGDETLLSAFVSGVQTGIGNELAKSELTTFHRAVQQAVRLESVERARPGRKTELLAFNVEEVVNNPRTEDRGELERREFQKVVENHYLESQNGAYLPPAARPQYAPGQQPGRYTTQGLYNNKAQGEPYRMTYPEFKRRSAQRAEEYKKIVNGLVGASQSTTTAEGRDDAAKPYCIIHDTNTHHTRECGLLKDFKPVPAKSEPESNGKHVTFQTRNLGNYPAGLAQK